MSEPKIEESQVRQDFQSTGSQSSGSHPSMQPEAFAYPAKCGRPVALRACTECRKKRAKCDSQRPCGRCQAHGVSECYDDIAIRQSKEDLRTELKGLRERQDFVDQLLSALAEPGLSAPVLERLRAGQPLATILDWASEARSSSGILSDGAPASSDTPLLALSEHAGREVGQGPNNELVQHKIATGSPSYPPGLEQILWPRGAPTRTPSPEAWTDISSDTVLIHHLLALYFCWEYPVFAFLSRKHFMDDFHQGRHRYCSPLLVNSLLALGSRWSTRLTLRTDSNDANSSGDSFFVESVRLLNLETDRRSLTTIQALGIMSLREISCGRDVEGRYYSTQSIRLAVDMGLHRNADVGDPDLLYVQASAFWGAFQLDVVLSAATGSLPQYPYSSLLPPRPDFLADVEEAPWMPYTDDGSPRQSPHEQTSNATLTYDCFSQLTESISGALYTLYSPVSTITGEFLLNIYASYLKWYDQMPDVLRLGLNSTPSVLVSHMCYHFAIIHLFRPFLDLQVHGSDISPGHICHQAADAIQGLLRSYSQLYTLHRTPALVPCIALASAVAHLDKRTSNNSASPVDYDTEMITIGSTAQHIFDALDQDICDLKEMAACHYSATQALGLIGSLAKSLKVEITGLANRSFAAEDHDRLARPYVRRSVIEARRLEANGCLLNERTGGIYLPSIRPPGCYP